MNIIKKKRFIPLLDNSTSGFTLFEVLIVIAIISILAGVSIPALLKWLPNIHLKSSAREVYLILQNAKLQSAKENNCTTVVLTKNDFSSTPAIPAGFTFFRDNGNGTGGIACNGTLDGNEAIISQSSLLEDITLHSASNIGGTNAVCFTPTSIICGSNSGDIILKNDISRWYKISVSASGGVRQFDSSDGLNWRN